MELFADSPKDSSRQWKRTFPGSLPHVDSGACLRDSRQVDAGELERPERGRGGRRHEGRGPGLTQPVWRRPECWGTGGPQASTMGLRLWSLGVYNGELWQD